MEWSSLARAADKIAAVAVDLSQLDPSLAEAVRRGREAHPVTIACDDDREPWPDEARDVVRHAFQDGSFQAAIADIEATSPDLVLE